MVEQAPDSDRWWLTRLECMRELGFALFYMDYTDDEPWPEDQRERVKKLCLEWKENFEKPGQPYWKDLLHRIHEEIENMC